MKQSLYFCASTYIFIHNQNKLLQFLKIFGIGFIGLGSFHIDVCQELRLRYVRLWCQRVMPVLGRNYVILIIGLVNLLAEYFSEN